MTNPIDLPSVSEIINTLPENLETHEAVVTRLVQNAIDHYRKLARSGKSIPGRRQIVKNIVHSVVEQTQPSLRSIINGTGVVLHTGFGRAPIGKDILSRVIERMTGYVSLEYDLPSGKRGNRQDHVRLALAAICGSEDSLVVNNNAAAVLLVLNTLADQREVIISRGQLVEIGGSFRIPDIIKKSQCRMVEVGTTNRTHLSDYENAITDKTGLLLWVHTSNYVVSGFTKAVGLSELVELGRHKRIPVMADLGSGAILNLSSLGMPNEMLVQDVLKTGVSVATFSGDKLLGGPQLGIITGRRAVIRRIESNPLVRTMRCDKITLAITEEILKTYRKHEVLGENLALSLLRTNRTELKRRATDILASLPSEIRDVLGVSVVESEVEAGSGSLPVQPIESAALRFKSRAVSPGALARKFRLGNPPVVGYTVEGNFFIDLKSVLPDQLPALGQAIRDVGGTLGQ